MPDKVHVSFITRAGEAVAFDADAEQVERRRQGKRKLTEYNRFVRAHVSKPPPATDLEGGRAKLIQAASAWTEQTKGRKRTLFDRAGRK
jgi:hypothetical protein